MNKKDRYLDEIYDEGEKINIKEIFSVLMEYKKSILLITLLLTTIAAYRAYFTPSVYKATVILKIAKERAYSSYSDFLNASMGGRCQ